MSIPGGARTWRPDSAARKQPDSLKRVPVRPANPDFRRANAPVNSPVSSLDCGDTVDRVITDAQHHRPDLGPDDSCCAAVRNAGVVPARVAAERTAGGRTQRAVQRRCQLPAGAAVIDRTGMAAAAPASDFPRSSVFRSEPDAANRAAVGDHRSVASRRLVGAADRRRTSRHPRAGRSRSAARAVIPVRLSVGAGPVALPVRHGAPRARYRGNDPSRLRSARLTALGSVAGGRRLERDLRFAPRSVHDSSRNGRRRRPGDRGTSIEVHLAGHHRAPDL